MPKHVVYLDHCFYYGILHRNHRKITGFLQASLSKIKELLKDFPTVFKD